MSLSILFVDDDSNIIGGIRRMMYSMRDEWDLYFANGGKEAIDLLDHNNIDVIISDIRMPGIDGTQLLTFVRDNYPQIVRITLSGYANDNTSIKNSRIVHQSLSKPATKESVKHAIEKAYNLRKRLNNDELLKIINGIDSLPSLPEIYLKLENEINSPNSSIEKLSKIIETDPIISAKILQLTNSAFFGLANRISNISQALNFLGIKLIQNLVLSIKLFSAIDSNGPDVEVYHKIWEHSNKTAFIAKQISTIKKISKSDIEECYLGGLLHDIGKIVLLEKSTDKKIVEQLSLAEHANEYPINLHADIGAYLLGIWGLPDSIVEAVAFHHSDEIFFSEELNVAKVVYIANLFAKNSELTSLDITENNIDELVHKIVKSQVENKN